jgi:hypothetical protein
MTFLEVVLKRNDMIAVISLQCWAPLQVQLDRGRLWEDGFFKGRAEEK